MILQPHLSKKYCSWWLDTCWLATKWPILVPFVWNGPSKTQIFTNICTFSVGGCWGQPILLFLKTGWWNSNTKPQNFRTTFKQILVCIFLSVTVNSKVTLLYEIPCISSRGITFVIFEVFFYCMIMEVSWRLLSLYATLKSLFSSVH